MTQKYFFKSHCAEQCLRSQCQYPYLPQPSVRMQDDVCFVHCILSLLGEMGYATKMKLVLNMLMGTMLAGLAETLALAEKVGLNTANVLNILSHTSGSSALLRTKGTGKYFCHM